MKNFVFTSLLSFLFVLTAFTTTAAPNSTLADKSSPSIVEKKKEEEKSFFKKLFFKKKLLKKAGEKSINKHALAELFILTIASFLIVGIGILAFLLAWSGINALAILVLIVGITSVIFGAIKLIKKIPKVRKRT